MYRLSVTATLPLSQHHVFDDIHEFEQYLSKAPSVSDVTRLDGGDDTPTYSIRLTRFGTSGTLTTKIVEYRPPSLITWRATRPIAGRWTVSDNEDGSSSSQIDILIHESELDKLPFGGGLMRRGLFAILRRAFISELRPILTHMVCEAGEDSTAIQLSRVRIDHDYDDEAGMKLLEGMSE